MKLTKQMRLRSFDHGQRRDCLASRLSLVTSISKSPTPNFEKVRDSLEERQSHPSKPILGLRGMWEQPRREAAPSERGLAFIEFALIVPLFVAFLLMSFYVAIYIRTWSAVNYAAKEAAKAASLSSAYTKLNFDHIPTDRPQLEINMEQCRASTLGADPDSVDPAKFLECIQKATASGAVSALLPADYTGNDITANQKYHLPFSLFEQPRNIPGYFPVQVLPMIGIERSCREPSNETSSNIGTADKRCYGSNCTGGCNHVKPTYWQSPVHADFDRDGKEDLVFFRPHGAESNYGDMSAPGEMDFIVMKSGNAYSFFGGHGYMNLTTEPSTASNGIPDRPYPIPVVADYDRDGVADYAVFEPSTGIIRIALSTTRYRIIIESTVTIDDPTDGVGLIAIPGTYHSTSEMEVAIIATATSDPAKRYNIKFAKPKIPLYSDMKSWARGTYPVNAWANTNPSSVITEAKYKPRPGQSSVPAFGDYDDDGITEIGYLSYPGGNLAKQIGGNVPNLNDPAEVASAPLFPIADSYSDPMQVRMNPFDMAMDRAGNMFYSDAVDGRIWKVRGDGGSNGVRGDFRGAAVEVVVGLHAALPPRDVRQTDFDPQNDFPRENVWNIPPDLSTLRTLTTQPSFYDTENLSAPAGSIVLSTPRKMAIGPDGAMYIADFGNGRIVRVDGSSGLSRSSNATVILGSNKIPACDPDPKKVDCNILVAADGSKTGNKFHPSAVEIIPDPTISSRYSLAFSAGYNIYLLSPPVGNGGGPTGSVSDLLMVLAGTGVQPSTISTKPDDSISRLIYLSSTGQSALSTSICPISSLKYDTETKTLFGASSCSLTTYPAAIANPIPERVEVSDRQPDPSLVWQPTTISGILAFNPSDNNDLANGAIITPFAGGFWRRPCNHDKCSAPEWKRETYAGVYQRKVDITAVGLAIKDIDLINVTSIALGTKLPGDTNRRPLVFIDQWNNTMVSSDIGGTALPGSYYLLPNATDEQHQQGIYMIERNNSGSGVAIQAITNPFSFGGGTVPVESAMWKTESSSTAHITAQEGPIKTIAFPAISNVLIDPMRGKLYSATPHLALPGTASSNQFWIDNIASSARSVGFIYKADLDLDGDGIADRTDPDIDGDSAVSGNESADSQTLRSHYCAEVDLGSTPQTCRTQEKIGNPTQYFFKATDDQNVALTNGEPGDIADSKFREYFFFNSVAGDSNRVHRKSRSEVWATLLGFGDDQDYDNIPNAHLACDKVNEFTNPSDPYYRCSSTSNGPIAAPAPLFSFVSGRCTRDSCGTQFQSSYKGNSYWSKVSGGYHGPEDTDSGIVSNQQFLFPALLSSTMPKENGIKPTRSPIKMVGTSTLPYTSGITCLAYTSTAQKGFALVRKSYGIENSVDLPAPHFRPFGLDMRLYLSNYQFARATYKDSATSDNDNLRYLPTCEAPLNDEIATEGIVLQLNHDYPAGHPNGLNGTANTRQLIMLDTDGDGARNGGTWLTTDAFDSSVRDIAGKGTLNLVASDLRALNVSDNGQVSSLAPLNLARQPWGIPSVASNSTIAPYSDSDSTLAGLPANDPRAYDSASLTMPNPNKMAKVALDFDKRFGAKFNTTSMKGEAAVGAEMNAKYVTQDFSQGGSRVAGENALKLSLGATIVSDGAALNPGEGTVRLSPSKDSVRVSYKPKIPLFPTIEVESKISAANQLSAAH